MRRPVRNDDGFCRRAAGPRFRRFLAAWVPAFCLPLAVVAQENPPAPPAEAPRVAVDAKTVEEELRRIEGSTALDDATKAKALELLRQAAQDLKDAEQWSARAAAHDQAIQEAPARLKALREELSRPAPEIKVERPPDAEVADLEVILANEQAALKAAQDEKSAVDRDRTERTERAQKIPDEIQKVRQELEAARTAPEAAPDEPAVVTQARQTRRLARARLLECQLAALEKEAPSYAARGDLLTARADVAARRIAQAEATVKAWQQIVNDARKADAERAAREAQQARMDAARKHPVLQSLADENARHAEARKALAKKIEAASASLEQVKASLKKHTDDLASIKAKIAAAGLTTDLGEVLRRQRANLPSVAEHRKALAQGEAENSAVLLETYKIDDERALLRDLDGAVADVVARINGDVAPEEAETLKLAARELLSSRAALLDGLKRDYESYSSLQLIELNSRRRELIAKVEEYAAYIDERVLWVRSTGWPTRADVIDGWNAVRSMFNPQEWAPVPRRLKTMLRQNPEDVLSSAVTVLIVLVLTLMHHAMVRRLRASSEEANKKLQTSIVPTLRALALTVLLSLTQPLLLWSLAAIVERLSDVNAYTAAAADALKRAAIGLAMLEFLRQTCRPDGLGEGHFDWPSRALRVARRQLFWLKWVWLPTLFVSLVVDRVQDGAWQSSLGRACFIMRQGIFCVIVYRLFRRQGGVMQESLASRESTWAARLHWLWFPALVALPPFLAALTISGYYYTAINLAPRLLVTLPLAMGVVFTAALALRWLVLSHRRLAIEQARKRRAAMAETAEGEAPPEPDLPQATLASLGEQTRNMLRLVLSVIFVSVVWLVWVDVLPALRVLDRVELWTVQESRTRQIESADGLTRADTVTHLAPVTLRHVLVSAAVVLLSGLAYRNLPGLIEFTILQRLPMKPGARFAATTVTRYLIIVIGVIYAFQNIGVTWDKYQWLVAALSVGIGFGLQEIVANFISGLIILIERPIRLGDIVTVGNIDGKVTRIQIRATTITDWDHRDLVVPNKEFITGPVVNWTLTDSITRITIPVGVAYGSDTDLARKILEDVAKRCPHVLAEPAPNAVFHGFGDSALNLTLRIHVGNRDLWAEIMNELHTNIAGEFRRAGIEIAFPQRDLHIRSIQSPIVVEQAEPRGSPSSR